jgi:hypothetical protein
VGEQNEGPTTGTQTLVGAPNPDLTPGARELDAQVAVLTMPHRPHSFVDIRPIRKYGKETTCPSTSATAQKDF